MDEVKNPWLALAGHEELWQNFPADPAQRENILHRLASGETVIAADTLGFSAADCAKLEQAPGTFALRRIQGRAYVTAQRYIPLVDFFLSAGVGGATGNGTQQEALELMLAGKNILITGGPGTGKSHLIGEFIVQKGGTETARPLRIVIAAPTGKAAARFKKIIPPGNILLECSTIHRLLGMNPQGGRMRFHARNPLGCDILILDETSMVDLGLFTALVRALPPTAQLILAGDLNQLPSVDGLPIDKTIRLLAETRLIHHTHLTEVHRFSAEKAAAYAAIAAAGVPALSTPTPGIARFTIARASGLAEFLDAYGQDRFCSQQALQLKLALQQLESGEITAAPAVKEAFAFMKRQIILAEMREGLQGSIEINRRIGSRIEKLQNTKNRTLTPVIATVNNYRLELFNGDTGFIIERAGAGIAVFEGNDGGYRSFPLQNISGLETAYAITIHKSQGSEYEDVFVMHNPKRQENDHRLIYTAVTRARGNATILEMG